VALNKIDKRVVALVGGVGGAKMAHGLAQILPPEHLTVIVNTGDDFWHYGLRICPDLDTVMYTLSGLVDKTNGWGVGGDTTTTLAALTRYGEQPWFRLGDQDMATHLLRSEGLRRGESLTQVMARLTKNLGIAHPVLPMTDAEVPTMIDTVEYGELEFQVYFVKHRWQPTVKGVRYANIEQATVTAEVREAIEAADMVLFAPSNPWLSVAPILNVPGMRSLLLARDIPRVAVSPIVGGQAIKGPAAKIMAELGYDDISARTVAAFYADVINGFVYDARDADLRLEVSLGGVRTVTFDTVMTTEAHRARLATEILEWVEKEWVGVT